MPSLGYRIVETDPVLPATIEDEDDVVDVYLNKTLGDNESSFSASAKISNLGDQSARPQSFAVFKPNTTTHKGYIYAPSSELYQDAVGEYTISDVTHEVDGVSTTVSKISMKIYDSALDGNVATLSSLTLL